MQYIVILKLPLATNAPILTSDRKRANYLKIHAESVKSFSNPG